MINPEEIGNIVRAEESLWWFRGMRRIAFALLDPLLGSNQVERIFEGGAGTGYFAALVAARYGVRVVAADLDAQAVRISHRRHGIPSVQANLLALPFPDASFDLVLLMDVLAHFARGEDLVAFGECARLVRPGGRLLVRTSALEIFRSRHSEFVWERQRFTPGRLRNLAAAGGLEIERLTFANCLLSPLALFKFRIWEPLVRARPASGLKPLPAPVDRLFYAALHLESLLVRAGLRLPFGQSLYLVARKPH
jgi:SAM-dependent methyltransferase